MKHRFLVAAEGLSKEADGKFIEYLKENGCGWWHRISNFWLITDRKDVITASGLRDKIMELHESGKPCLVMQVNEDVTWAAVKRSGQPDMFDWLQNTWRKE